MNFFGHAAVASWHDAAVEPGYVLGAMLPDFVGMVRGRVGVLATGPISDGVSLHHQTDSVFHQLPAVTRLMSKLSQDLALRGVSRGPMRAAAHLGIELLLDGELVATSTYSQAYLSALELDAPAMSSPEEQQRLRNLMVRLRAHGVPDDLREPGLAARRTVRAIASRPRLAATGEEPMQIAAAFVAIAEEVSTSVEGILQGLRAGLATATHGA